MSATKTKKPVSPYQFAVVITGIAEWRRESFYDTYTNKPRVVAVAKTREEAESFVTAEQSRDQRTPLLPGLGSHRIFEVVSLADETTYVSRQDAARFSVNVAEHKYALIANKDIVKI